MTLKTKIYFFLQLRVQLTSSINISKIIFKFFLNTFILYTLQQPPPLNCQGCHFFLIKKHWLASYPNSVKKVINHCTFWRTRFSKHTLIDKPLPGLRQLLHWKRKQMKFVLQFIPAHFYPNVLTYKFYKKRMGCNAG
jgi:hypothetical protein